MSAINTNEITNTEHELLSIEQTNRLVDTEGAVKDMSSLTAATEVAPLDAMEILPDEKIKLLTPGERLWYFTKLSTQHIDQCIHLYPYRDHSPQIQFELMWIAIKTVRRDLTEVHREQLKQNQSALHRFKTLMGLKRDCELTRAARNLEFEFRQRANEKTLSQEELDTYAFGTYRYQCQLEGWFHERIAQLIARAHLPGPQ